MGSVGLNFGSATSGAGFDVTSTVAAIVNNLQVVENPWKSEIAALQAKDAAFTKIGTDLSTLTTNLQALTDFQGALSAKQGSSSNTNILTLTNATATATAGSHTITVSQLAQTSSEYSGVVANASDTLSGSLTIQVGSGTAQTITVGSSSNTLATFAAAINAAGIGVAANVITDSSGSRLSLVSGTSGAGGQLTLSGTGLTDATTSAAIGFTVGQSGQDASLNVDGIALTSAGNTVTGAIPGVTFQLLSSSPGTPVQVQIANDNTAVETAVQSFATSYNTVVADIAAQEQNGANGQPQPLFGDTTLAELQQSLASALNSGAPSGGIGSMSQLGLSANQDGTLTLNTSTLDGALNANYGDVVGFLQNSGSFGQNFASVLNQVDNQAPDGTVYLALQQDSQQETALNADITSQNLLISQQQATLTTELNAANTTLTEIPAQLNEVSQIYSAISGYVAPRF